MNSTRTPGSGGLLTLGTRALHTVSLAHSKDLTPGWRMAKDTGVQARIDSGSNHRKYIVQPSCPCVLGGAQLHVVKTSWPPAGGSVDRPFVDALTCSVSLPTHNLFPYQASVHGLRTP